MTTKHPAVPPTSGNGSHAGYPPRELKLRERQCVVRKPVLSYGARTLEAIIRRARPHKGGGRHCGRPYLARRMGCSVRSVSKYLKELRDAGRIEVTPPRKERTPEGWRSIGVNIIRLVTAAHPAPHVQGRERLRRSRRGASPRTPSPSGDWAPAPPGARDQSRQPQHDHEPIDLDAYLANLIRSRGWAS